MACYKGPNPVTDEERFGIWKWVKDNYIDKGVTDYAKIHDAVNGFFFGGMAKPEWITDIISGRKMPFKAAADDLWRKQYNRRAVVQQAQMLASRNALGPLGRVVQRMRFIPRTVSVFGHGIVFPVTHAGDLLLRPASWGTFIRGALRTYRSAASSAYAARVMESLPLDPMYDLALRSGVDVGPKSRPVGLISQGAGGKLFQALDRATGGMTGVPGGKTGFLNAANRAWDMLTVMRFELWKKQMGKFVKPGMSSAEKLDIGKNLAEWANNATGSGKGKIANLAGGTLFGPKLTQSKLNRIFSDPVETARTVANWKNATAGEKAVAWTRISGATQYLLSSLGFMAVGQGLLSAFGSKDKINVTDSTKSDYFAFKGYGLHGYIPGMHTEIRTLAKLLNIAFMKSQVPGKTKPMIQNPELHGESKSSLIAKTLGQYAMAKLEPGIQRGVEVATGQNWQGRPLPWSSDQGTEKKPKLTYGEYLGSIGPIPLEGPIGYVYDQLRKNGSSAGEANSIIKGLIIFGGGLPGFHVVPDYEKPSASSTSPNYRPGKTLNQALRERQMQLLHR